MQRHKTHRHHIHIADQQDVTETRRAPFVVEKLLQLFRIIHSTSLLQGAVQ